MTATSDRRPTSDGSTDTLDPRTLDTGTAGATAGRSPRALLVAGLLVALLSAVTFGSSGAVGKSILNAGWTPAAAVTVRILVGALVLAGPAVWSMRGRWHLLRRRGTWVHLGIFGVLAVAGCQLFYFLAVTELSVGVALMLEYLGPILVVLWLWLAHGQQPRRLTLVGTGLAVVGLLLVLDVLGDAQVSMLGVLWGLLAAIGLATFFVVGADDSTGLPPVAFAALGMAVGGVVLGLAGVTRLVPFEVSTADVTVAGQLLPWWVPVVWLGLVAAAIAYGTGIVASRALGAKLASFVGLSEVLFAVLWAWLLLGEMPATVQLLGGALIVAGVVAVKADERPGTPAPVAVEVVAVEPVVEPVAVDPGVEGQGAVERVTVGSEPTA